MTIPLKYFNVNWVNGMKINKDHFIQQENAFIDKMKDILACQLNDRNFGLLPASGNNTSFEIITKVDNQNILKVKIFQCRAITQGGARIEILKEFDFPEFSVSLTDEIGANKDSEGNLYYIVLSVDLFACEPFGNLNSDEEPPRSPFVIPSYKINLVAEKQIVKEEFNPYSLFIGKVKMLHGSPEIIDEYIPPCINIMSHEKLISFYSGVDKFFGQLEIDLLTIIKKIKEKEQSTNLADSAQILANNLLNYLNNNILNFRWIIIDQPPISMFEKIASLARIIKNTLDANTSSNKEELLNYFTNWSELKPGDFEELLVQCVNFDYNHYEINKLLIQFTHLVETLAVLFEKLSNLAYIGKKKETGIFVKEDKPRRSFLAD